MSEYQLSFTATSFFSGKVLHSGFWCEIYAASQQQAQAKAQEIISLDYVGDMESNIKGWFTIEFTSDTTATVFFQNVPTLEISDIEILMTDCNHDM